MTSKVEFSRGDVIAEKYEVVDKLDDCPLGTTYRVKQLDSGSYVRLTLLDERVCESGTERMKETFQAAKAVEHPHLCKILELDQHDEGWLYTSEDFEGRSLRELLAQNRTKSRSFSLKEAFQICMQILEGLDALHQRGVVLRALRPEYVLVNLRWTGPQQDTLIAETRLVGAGMWDLVSTQALAEDEFSRGEAQYLAPELKGFEPVPTARSDIYSVGVLLYELLIGQPPVGTFQLPKSRRPELPEHVDDMVELALAQAPEDRYPAAQDFIQDIRRTFQDAALAQTPPERPMMTPVGWGIALGVVALAGAALFLLRPDETREREELDAAVRKEVFDEIQATRPPPEVFKSMYAKHPQNMIYVPDGPYLAGRLHSEDAYVSEPLAEKRRTKGFLIDVFEHPNLEGAAPTFGVTYAEAEGLCAEQGKRLCTAEEWERACKGPRSQIYSYGDFYDPEHCGQGVEDPAPSGTRSLCRSEYGVFDMSGGFREWTRSVHKEGRVLVKGGLKSQPEKGTRCALATDESIRLADQSIGFRCCRDPEAPPVDPVAQD